MIQDSKRERNKTIVFHLYFCIHSSSSWHLPKNHLKCCWLHRSHDDFCSLGTDIVLLAFGGRWLSVTKTLVGFSKIYIFSGFWRKTKQNYNPQGVFLRFTEGPVADKPVNKNMKQIQYLNVFSLYVPSNSAFHFTLLAVLWVGLCKRQLLLIVKLQPIH